MPVKSRYWRGIVVDQPVVGVVVDAAHREGRTEVVALGGVVVDDVEDHLDPGGVQRLDHRLELGDAPGAAAHGVAVVRGQVGDRVVAPVVAQATFGEVMVVDELVHGHQLDGRHAEAGEVVDHGRVGDPGVRATQRRRDAGVGDRQAADVGLVDDRLVHRVARWPVVGPVEEGVADEAERNVRGAVGRVRPRRISRS